jgi:hypothetical protein
VETLCLTLPLATVHSVSTHYVRIQAVPLLLRAVSHLGTRFAPVSAEHLHLSYRREGRAEQGGVEQREGERYGEQE